MGAGGGVQELGWAEEFLIRVFTLEFNLLYLKINLRACSHESCQPSLFSMDLKTKIPKELSALPAFTMSWGLLALQTFVNE